MSWIPETRIDANIITAAPPSTDCGIMDTNAAIFGQSPQRIRKMAPQESAIRFTIFVIEIMPTFCAKEVFGRTPSAAAKLDPRPSQMIPPESSESVASRSIPLSTQAQISPTVSTVVTMNMIATGRIASTRKTGFTSASFPKPAIPGSANQDASFTCWKLTTQEYV